MSDDFLDKIEDTPPKRKGSRRITTDPTARISGGQARAVTADERDRTPQSMQAGKYVRQTITILPGQRKLIKQLAAENNISLLALYRWLLDQGLQAYEAGERPEPESPVYQDVRMGHWSSR